MLTLLAFERLLSEYDIELHTIEGQIDTSTPTGFMSYAMRAFVGEMERRQIKYRTKRRRFSIRSRRTRLWARSRMDTEEMAIC